MSDVFISYSRKNSEFVRILHEALEKSNRETWVDWRGIAKGTEWWKEIEEGIEGADTFVFVISPDSVASTVCQDEINHAVKHNKQILPIVYREPENEKEPNNKNFDFEPNNPAHKAIRSHNWLFFREEDDFSQSLTELIDALNLDIAHVKGHTHFLVRALEWDNKGRKDGFLLKDENLIEAEDWLKLGVNKDPKPTNLQKTYIENSRKIEDANNQATKILKDAAQKANQRIRVSLAVLGITLIGATAAAVFASNAVKQGKDSEDKAKQFETQLTSSKLQVKQADEDKKKLLIDKEKIKKQINTISTQLISVEKNKKQADTQRKVAEAKVKQANIQLQNATRRGELATQQANNATQTAEQAKRDQAQAMLARNEAQKAVKIAQQKENVLLIKSNQLQYEQNRLTQRNKEVQNNLKNSNIQLLVTEAKYLWQDNPRTLDSLLIALKAGNHLQNQINSNASVSNLVEWQVKVALQQIEQTIQERNRLNFSTSPKFPISPEDAAKSFFDNGSMNVSIAFSSDGQRIFFANENEYSVWGIKERKKLKTFSINREGSGAYKTQVSFSPDGQLLATRQTGETKVKVWNTEINKIRDLVDLDLREVQWLPFEYVGGDMTGKIWAASCLSKKDKEVLSKLNFYNVISIIFSEPQEKSELLTSACFSYNGQTLATGYRTGIVKLWDIGIEQKFKTLNGHKEDVLSISFSPDGEVLATGSSDGMVKLWDVSTGREFSTFAGHRGSVHSVIFSPDGQTLATGGSDQIVRLWDLKSGQKKRFQNQTFPLGDSRSLSSDGKILATVVGVRAIKLWDVETKTQFATISEHEGEIWGVSFSPDSNTLIGTGWGNGHILWNFDLNTLMRSGCTWIGDYLGSHPEETELQQICQPYLSGKSNPKP